MLPVVYFIRSVQFVPKSMTITEQTKADILCAVKCCVLAVRHNKHIAVHANCAAPHATSFLCLAVLDTYGESGEFS